jgi:hypothetical protein
MYRHVEVAAVGLTSTWLTNVIWLGVVIGVIRASLYESCAVPAYVNPVTWLTFSRQLISGPPVPK